MGQALAARDDERHLSVMILRKDTYTSVTALSANLPHKLVKLASAVNV